MLRTSVILTTLLLAGALVLDGQSTSRNNPSAQSEKSGESTSRIEAFAKRRGRVIVAEEYLVAKLPDPQGSNIPVLELSVMVDYEAGKRAERVKGVELEIYRGTGKLPGTILLDIDSAAEIPRAIAQLQALDLELSQKQASAAAYTAEYSTSNMFAIGLTINREGRHEVVMSMPGTSTNLRLADLDTLHEAFEAAVKLASSK